MIHRIEIENFHSIKDRQVLDLRVPGKAPKVSERLAPCWRGSEERAPKVIGIFGANGAGKTNVLKALTFVSWFLQHSFSYNSHGTMPFDAFNDDEGLNGQSKITIWTSGVSDLSELEKSDPAQCRYIYELCIDCKFPRRVAFETIYYFPKSHAHKRRLFSRDQDGHVEASKGFALAGFKGALEKVLRPNVSVISTLVQLNHPFAQAIANSAERVVSNLWLENLVPNDQDAKSAFLQNESLLANFNAIVQSADLGINQINVHQSDDGSKDLLFEHEGLALPMPLKLESHGTRQLFKLFPLLHNALQIGGIAIVDELDSAIHPLVLRDVLSWFHSPLKNKRNAQLWMSVQNATVLEELSKDEIAFCEKDHRGVTQVYALNDIKSVRRDDNYYKKYMGGVYGAVPHLG